MCDERSDENLDAELRNIKVPRSLLAHLKQVAHPTNSEIDAAIRSISLPSGLPDRVKRACADAALDELIRTLDVPDQLLARLRVIPRSRSSSTLGRVALAASLLLVVTGSFFSTLGGLLAAIRPPLSTATSLQVIDIGPARLVASPPDSDRISIENSTTPFGRITVPVAWHASPLEVELVALDYTTTGGPTGQLIRDVERGLELGGDVLLRQWDMYASPQQISQRMPELEQIRRLPNVGVDLPIVTGYDRAFMHRTSTHPPVLTAASERLQTIRVPLSASVASVRRTEQLVERGRLPAPREVRTEDFLAAIEYRFASPDDEDVAVTMTAGPAVFGNQQHSLLQIGAKAARRLGNLATHVSVVVDVSQSMRRQQRLAALRESLQTMFDHLGPDDSLSLVAVNHEVTQQIDFATADQQAVLGKWLGELRLGGGTRLDVGVRSGITLASQAPRHAGILRQLVVLSDGEERPTRDLRLELGELLHIAAADGIRTTVLELRDPEAALDQRDNGVASISLVTPDALPWKLTECVTGVAPEVARQAEFQVYFNPRAVRAYRLVGHGPVALTGLGEEGWSADLRSAEEATLLFEIWMHESYEGQVASAAVHWLSPDSGETKQSRPAVLGRYGFATSWLESAAALQMASIAAEIGERLRGVGDFQLHGERSFREVKRPSGWEDILEAADDVPIQVADHADFQRLIDLVQKLEALRQYAREIEPL